VELAARSGGFSYEPVSHLAQALDLGLHDIARLEEGVGALADATAGAAAENVASLDCKNVRGVFDLLLGREYELRGIAVLLDFAVDGEAEGPGRWSRSRGLVQVPARHHASPALAGRGAWSALRRLRRQLVRELWPLAFHNCTHLVRDDFNAFDLEHVFVQPLEIGLQHDLAADDTELIDAAAFPFHVPLAAGDCRGRSARAGAGRRFLENR
jgi:hypothetical protein